MQQHQTLWSLAPRQMNILERIRQTIHRLAVRNGVTDRPAAEAALRQIYQSIGHTPPTQFIWADDPMEGAVLATIYQMMMDYQTTGSAFSESPHHWLDVLFGKVETLPWEEYKIPAHATSPAYLYFMDASEKLSQCIPNTLKLQNQSLWEELWGETCARATAGQQESPHPALPLFHEESLLREFQPVFGPVFVRQVVKTVTGDKFAAQEFTRNRDLSQLLFKMIELPSYADWAAHKAWESIRRQLIRKHQQASLTLRDISSLAAYGFLSMLNGAMSQSQLASLLKAVGTLGQFWHFGDTVILCPKPTALHLNTQSQLHAEGRPAVCYPGRYALYANSGEVIPPEYGRLPISQWQSRWLLEESDIALRRLMIRQIGYGRICQELPSVSLDRWGDYELLRIDNADIEPIMLIKMKCPSTGMIHVHRVPPTVQTAREAIAWCNWEIDPTGFLKQT